MTAVVGPVEQAVTTDGVSIAFQSIGQGPPLLNVAQPGFPLRYEEASAARGRLRQKFYDSCSVVTWESPGIGLSDRSPPEFSMDAWVRHATAVAERLGPPVPVYARAFSGPVAITLAAQRPDLVSHLVLVDTGVSGSDLQGMDEMAANWALLDISYELMVQFMVRVVLRLEGPAASAVIDVFREEVEPGVMRQAFDAVRDFDARDLASKVDAPTLIIEQPTNSWDSYSPLTRELSRLIPGARLIRGGDIEGTSEQVVSFLFETTVTGDAHGAFRTIMFTDLVASTALTQRVGDDAAQRVVEAHDAAVRDALNTHNGVEIKHTGDGIMAAFDSATDAARAAAQISNRLTSEGVGIRVGLNAGEPIERDGDLFGTAVQLAARVGDAADTGQVLATQVVRDLTAGKGLNWSSAPALDAKGFDEPIAIFALNLDQPPPNAGYVTSRC